MGKAITFEIILNRRDRTYHPGEVVSGECVIELKESLKFRSVNIEFIGEAKTTWDEMENYTTTHKDEEIYFHKKNSLLASGNEKKGSVSVLSPGKHVLEFSFKIPPFSLPSSFESKQGHVRYYLRARIVRPWRFDEVTKEIVHVIDLIDVNCPRMLMPVFGEAQRSLNCLRNGTAAPLQAIVQTDRSGYCPGEKCSLSVEIKNLPLTDKYHTTINLIQNVTFKSRCGKHRSEYKRLKLLQRSSSSYNLDEVEIPDVVPSMRNCGILSVTYCLKVVISLAQGQDGIDLEVDLPITIGTVPLRKSYGLISKMIPFSQLHESKFNNKTFVTIKHMSEVNLFSMSAVAT